MIRGYEGLKIWERVDPLAFEGFGVTEKFPRRYQYDLTSQLRRASLSISTNIAEGSAGLHSGEFLQFLNVSRKSLSETNYLLYFATGRNLIEQNKLLELEWIYEEISKMLKALAKSIGKRKRST